MQFLSHRKSEKWENMAKTPFKVCGNRKSPFGSCGKPEKPKKTMKSYGNWKIRKKPWKARKRRYFLQKPGNRPPITPLKIWWLWRQPGTPTTLSLPYILIRISMAQPSKTSWESCLYYTCSTCSRIPAPVRSTPFYLHVTSNYTHNWLVPLNCTFLTCPDYYSIHSYME